MNVSVAEGRCDRASGIWNISLTTRIISFASLYHIKTSRFFIDCCTLLNMSRHCVSKVISVTLINKVIDNSHPWLHVAGNSACTSVTAGEYFRVRANSKLKPCACKVRNYNTRSPKSQDDYPTMYSVASFSMCHCSTGYTYKNIIGIYVL